MVEARAIDRRPAPPPNIIIFLVDDMGWQETSVPFHRTVTPLNQRYRTPAMERLAREGVRFTHAYASAVCSPTRISIISGMNAARHGVTNWTLRKGLSPDDPLERIDPPLWNVNGATTQSGIERTVRITPLPTLLRGAGYRTIHVGKAHYGAAGTPGEDPRHFGFDINIAGHAAGAPGSYYGENNFSAASRRGGDRIWDVPGLSRWHGQKINLTEVLTLEAIDQIERAVADRQRFFLNLSHYAVHSPWEEDRRFYQKYLDQGLKPMEALRASMIESMDHSLGELLKALDRLGLTRNTLIIFASDNGAPHAVPANHPLRAQKLAPYEGGIRIPMIIRWPGIASPGKSYESNVIIEDLFPTILETAGVVWRGKTMQTIDGRSLIPALRDQQPRDVRDLIFHFPHQYYMQGPFSALIQGRWKLIHHYTDGKDELFNLDQDISEENDLYNTDLRRGERMAKSLARHLRGMGAMIPIDRGTGQRLALPGHRQTGH
ncbi:MAG: sulfatase [Acidobacteriota bacterium]